MRKTGSSVSGNAIWSILIKTFDNKLVTCLINYIPPSIFSFSWYYLLFIDPFSVSLSVLKPSTNARRGKRSVSDVEMLQFYTFPCSKGFFYVQTILYALHGVRNWVPIPQKANFRWPSLSLSRPRKTTDLDEDRTCSPELKDSNHLFETYVFMTRMRIS